MIKVKKRDGREKPLDEERIFSAISRAYEDFYGEKYHNEAILSDIVDEVVKEIQHFIEKNKTSIIEIEKIQDIVIKNIEKVNKDVAKCYKKYRDMRTEERERSSEKERYYREILECTNIDNDNANVDQHSFSGRKYRIADYEQKMYAIRNLLSPSARKAFEDALIYHHDLSSYAIGEHNCLFADLDRLLLEGFETRNGDVRTASCFSTACQLIAVIFQCQSQIQYGGVASNHLDFTLAKFVKRSFIKLFKEGFFEKYDMVLEIDDKYIYIDNEELKDNFPKAFDYAIRHLEKEGRQSCESLYHNLNTLESRAGSQLPFTSINLGRDTSTEGRFVNKWIFEASLNGIGEFGRTSIFPISIFQYKKGVNDKPGTPNYDMKKLAIKSLSKRIYPNFVNGDWNKNKEEEGNPDTYQATMGCRTLVGYDIHTDSYIKTGRGNISPITIILPKLGLDYGIALGKRDKADLDGFIKAFDETLYLVRDALVDRYEYICNQSVRSAPFMYKNGTLFNHDKCTDGTVREAMKHGTNAIGILGMAECCVALFGKHHGESEEAYRFALDLVERIYNFCDKSTKELKINFSTYFSPAENLCKTAVNMLRFHYGIVEGVTSRKYLTNSIHIPVWYPIDAYTKILLEAPFGQYGTGGCISYVEMDGATLSNLDALESLIDYAMNLNVPYLAINFPIDTCKSCGYSSQITTNECPVCGSNYIERLKRVTGYTTTDFRNFNEGKFDEVNDRVVHNTFNPLTIPLIKIAKAKLRELGIEVKDEI